MFRWRPAHDPDADGALEAGAAGARAALACIYSSSAEYDAALIAARRAAGVYGPRRQRRQLLATLAAVCLGFAVVLVIVRLLG